MTRSTGKPLVVHDRAGALIAQALPYTGARRHQGRPQTDLPLAEFQRWLQAEAPSALGAISASPLGYTTVLQVEKRVAGYLSLLDGSASLAEFDRLVLTYGGGCLRHRNGEEPRHRLGSRADSRRLDSDVVKRHAGG